MKKFLLGMASIALLASCGSSDHGELVGVQDRPTWYPSEPYGMVYIPQGSFTMGNHDEDVPYSIDLIKDYQGRYQNLTQKF